MESLQYLIGLVAVAFLMGAVFDVYNTVTGSTKWLRWLRPAMDIIFWFLSAGFVYYVTFITAQGQLRIYTFVLLLLGYGLYWLLAHRRVIGAAYGVLRVIRVLAFLVFRVLSVLIFRPIQILLLLVWSLLRGLYRVGRVLEEGLCRAMSVVGKVIWFPFHWLWPRKSAWLTHLQNRWEDFWIWLSNKLVN